MSGVFKAIGKVFSAVGKVVAKVAPIILPVAALAMGAGLAGGAFLPGLEGSGGVLGALSGGAATGVAAPAAQLGTTAMSYAAGVPLETALTSASLTEGILPTVAASVGEIGAAPSIAMTGFGTAGSAGAGILGSSIPQFVAGSQAGVPGLAGNAASGGGGILDRFGLTGGDLLKAGGDFISNLNAPDAEAEAERDRQLVRELRDVSYARANGNTGLYQDTNRQFNQNAGQVPPYRSDEIIKEVPRGTA